MVGFVLRKISIEKEFTGGPRTSVVLPRDRWFTNFPRDPSFYANSYRKMILTLGNIRSNRDAECFYVLSPKFEKTKSPYFEFWKYKFHSHQKNQHDLWLWSHIDGFILSFYLGLRHKFLIHVYNVLYLHFRRNLAKRYLHRL